MLWKSTKQKRNRKFFTFYLFRLQQLSNILQAIINFHIWKISFRSRIRNVFNVGFFGFPHEFTSHFRCLKAKGIQNVFWKMFWFCFVEKRATWNFSSLDIRVKIDEKYIFSQLLLLFCCKYKFLWKNLLWQKVASNFINSKR